MFCASIWYLSGEVALDVVWCPRYRYLVEILHRLEVHWNFYVGALMVDVVIKLTIFAVGRTMLGWLMYLTSLKRILCCFCLGIA